MLFNVTLRRSLHHEAWLDNLPKMFFLKNFPVLINTKMSLFRSLQIQEAFLKILQERRVLCVAYKLCDRRLAIQKPVVGPHFFMRRAQDNDGPGMTH